VRLVLDTNIVVAGLLWRGAPHELLNRAIDNRFSSLSSAGLIAELGRVLAYPKFAQRIAANGLSIPALIECYARIAALVPAAEIDRVVQADPDDDQVLACALAAQADLIVSGDADLLNLKTYHRIPIVSAAEALARLPQTKE
jgi:putative PIN family toxin of toxin-antitoxin system